jgi:SNF2 family DNA or RNA helicase
MELEMLANLPDGEELPVMTALAQLQRLNQLSASACDVSTELVIEPDQFGVPTEKLRYHVTPKAPSWKAEAMVEVLAERPGRQSVVFSPSTGLIKVAAAYALKAGYRVGLIIGGQSAKARTAVVDAFQAGALDVVLANTKAGGVGITLTAADTVIFLQRPWSWVDASQAEDRAHRIGSEVHEAIEIVDIVAADTVDSRVREVLTDKAQSLADLLQDQRIASQAFGGEVHTTFSHKAGLK